MTLSGFINQSFTGCASLVEFVPDYLPAFGVFHATNGMCYPLDRDGKVQFYAYYGYNPKLSVGVAFTVLFGLFTLVQIGLAAKSRRWWMLVTAIGCGGEMAGWVGRALSGTRNDATNLSNSYFLVQIVCLTISPVFLSACCYGTFMILANRIEHKPRRFSMRWFVWFFVTIDIISLVLQAAGGGIASGSSGSGQLTGTHIMVGGIVFQLVSMLIFFVIIIDFYFRAKKMGSLNNSTKGEYYVAIALLIASLCIITRGFYRSIELGEGWNGYLITHEVYFLVLDATMMLICCLALSIGHPLFHIPKSKRAGGTPEVEKYLNGSRTSTPV